MFGIYTLEISAKVIDLKLEGILCDAETDLHGDGTIRTPLAYSDPVNENTTGLLPHLATATLGYTRIAGMLGGWARKDDKGNYTWVIRLSETKVQVGWLSKSLVGLQNVFFKEFLNQNYIKIIETEMDAPTAVLRPWTY